jgi:hypothetical protein
MSPVAEKTTKRRGRIRLWHVPVAVVVVLVGVLLGLRWHWVREYRKRIAAIAAAGYPVTPEGLDAWYEAPQSGENAADWVLDAGALINELPRKEREHLERIVSDRSDRLDWRESISGETKALMVAHVRENAKALELLHQAADMRESRYPVRFSEGPGKVFLTHLRDVQESALLLCLEAIVAGEAGDGEGATGALEACFGVARSLRAEPAYGSQGSRFGVQNRAAAAMARVLCVMELSDTQLERLAAAVNEACDADGVIRGLVGLRCACLEIFAKPESLDPDTFGKLPAPALLEAYSALGLAAREGILFLDMIDAYIGAARLPLHERWEAFEAIGDRSRARQRRCVLATRIWGGQTLRPFEVAGSAHLRVGLTALAVERFRLEMRRCPESLGELVPAYLEVVLDDPFDGVPLRYRRLDGGYVVYSVGENGVDDGGNERPPGEEEDDETLDITFAVLR